VDSNAFTRLTCCGKGMHNHCDERVEGSTMSRAQKNRCHECRATFPTTTEGNVKQIRVWVDKGKAWAETTLAHKYAFGVGVPQSYEEAIRYLNMAIKQGDPNAMFGLACMCEHGQGVAQSFKIAAELYASAAVQGHASAQYNLGNYYEQGKGVAQSYEKAFELYTLAAKQGQVNAQSNLGALYYEGNGVAQSNAMARKWWLKAALQENEEAIQNLKGIDQQEGKTTPTLPCCATCGTPKTTRRPLNACSQCHTTNYCNRDCQMNHWRAGHKRECKRLQKEHEKKNAAATGTGDK
jgi:TPR repeat protein